ncbi:pilus assembly protein TadG-related protein [Sphingomonas sp. LHG3406-1]|uniref:pilus assembly protein TadG-related protein n=1 Tax=Sphingomonas sp. LHG3406-1 TaxID=2804617 RepID=UPI002625AAC8|nr:pilus assembly protein TadG-related protein [Sphingomonas sp. LHG3406-1]
MLRLLKKLRRDERGNILIITAAAMPMLIGLAGLATDTIQWALWKRQLQRAADSAAIAGVYERNATPLGATTTVKQAVNRDLTLNQHAGSLLEEAELELDIADTPAPDRRINQVGVTLKLQKGLPFSSFFMPTAPIIRVRAVAASVPGAGEYCVIALDDRDVTGADIGGSTTVDLGDCCLIANSTHANEAFKNTGAGSTVKAGCIAAVGGVQYSKSPNWQVKNYFPYSEPAADPYANLPSPKPEDCTSSNTITMSSQQKDYPIDRSSTDDGQTICINGGFEVKGHLTLGAGTYIINTNGPNDDLTMNATDTSITCDGCTIILTNLTDPTKTGNFRLTGGTLDLKAPTALDAPYRGVALYQDRRAVDDGKRGTNHVNGNNTSGIQGVMYMPGRSLLYNGGGGVAQNKCMQLIAKRVDFTGNSGFKMGSLCGDAGLTGHSGGGWLVRLVS